MKKALLKLLALSLALTFVMGVLSGCGDTAEKDSDGDVVKIGFVTYLAGDQAYVGQAAKLALEDYVTELNENGGLLGKQVKLITYDYSKDPATEAVNATNKLIQQDGVIAILGPSGSQSAIPMIPVVTAAKIPVIATSASNEAVTIDPNTGKLNGCLEFALWILIKARHWQILLLQRPESARSHHWERLVIRIQRP